jgi:hypothetical protein
MVQKQPQPADGNYDADELAQAIGHVTVQFNGCQEMVFYVFWRLSDMPRACAEAVFMTLKSDSAQRDITLALAKARLATDGLSQYESLKTSLAKLNTLAGERNAAVHTMWGIHSDNRLDLESFVSNRHPKLSLKDCLGQFKKLRFELEIERHNLARVFTKLLEHAPSQRAEPVENCPREAEKPTGQAGNPGSQDP